MVVIPTRTDLYQMVDERFRAEYPNAPEKLSATDPQQEEMRNRWTAIRNDFLEHEANRIYWAEYPNAPIQIDPNDPAHDTYQRAWIEIREQIMENRPDLPDSPDTLDDVFLDDSWLQAKINESLVAKLPYIQPDLHDDVNAYAVAFMAAVRQAVQNKTFPNDPNLDSFHPDDKELTSSADATHVVKLWGSAWRDGDKIDGFLGLHAENPVAVTY